MPYGLLSDDVLGSGYLSNLFLIGASVTVYNSGTDPNDPTTWVLASLYSDPNGSTAKSNPLTTDGTGRFTAYATTGSYDLLISMPGYQNRWVYGVSVGVSGAAGRTVTLTDSVTLADSWLWVDATSGNIVLTLPDANTVSSLKSCGFFRQDGSANTVTITTGDGTTINGQASVTLNAQYEKITIMYDADAGEWRY